VAEGGKRWAGGWVAVGRSDGWSGWEGGGIAVIPEIKNLTFQVI
jgi:hypothetical protein